MCIRDRVLEEEGGGGGGGGGSLGKKAEEVLALGEGRVQAVKAAMEAALALCGGDEDEGDFRGEGWTFPNALQLGAIEAALGDADALVPRLTFFPSVAWGRAYDEHGLEEEDPELDEYVEGYAPPLGGEGPLRARLILSLIHISEPTRPY